MRATTTKPKIGDVRYVVEWIDKALMRKSESSEDDLIERMREATRHRVFSSLELAKAWAEANATLDEYDAPRLETQTYSLEYEGVPPEWVRGEYQEWMDDAWQPLVF